MSHPWFEGFNWIKLLNRTLDTPYNPMVGKWEQNFDENFLLEKVEDSYIEIDDDLLEKAGDKLKEFDHCKPNQ